MLGKVNEPANAEVGLVAVMTGAARGDGEEKWDSDSGASFRMPHTQAGMAACKRAPAGTTDQVADGTIFPIDGFGTVKVDLDQPGTTIKPVKMISVVHTPGHSWNLLSTRKAVGQWGKSLVYYLGFPGEESPVFNFCPRKGLFSATGVRRTPIHGATLGLAAKTAEAMRTEATGQCEPRADVGRKSSQGAVLALAVKKKGSVAFSLSTLRNMMCCVRFQGI